MANNTGIDLRTEIERINRVSDMMCTAHSGLRDRYKRRALFLDLAILAPSTWLAAVVFVEPRINIALTPLHFDPQIWIGILSIATFFASIVQMRVDWKGRADAHQRSFSIHSEVKKECVMLMAQQGVLSPAQCDATIHRYQTAADIGIEIPEKEFLKQKKRHLMKIALSKLLDQHPGASLLALRLRLWMRDNLSKLKE